ncbi:MAG TPA: DnaJ domain-containing protein, partial [Candidatus Limnocylindrales bacterium]|nr:DnaJ domain-containing protein [Candidatus Limnocylindrales bacterium]
MAVQRDYYETLGVDRNASDAEIKRAFRRLAQRYHPDVNKDPGAAERFKEINEAYQVLSDPQRRRTYDMFGRGAFAETDFGFGSGFPGFGDIFDAFFGTATTGARRPRHVAGADLRYDLRIGFEEAIRGTEKEITFSALARCPECGGSGADPGSGATTCPQCHGRGEVRTVRQTMLGQMMNIATCPRCRGEGRVIDVPCRRCRGEGRVEQERTLRVQIPPGIDSGHQIRLSGEGE